MIIAKISIANFGLIDVYLHLLPASANSATSLCFKVCKYKTECLKSSV